MSEQFPEITAVVFDMDGVLLDTEPLYRDAMMGACRALGFEMSAELHLAQVGIPGDVGSRMMLDHFGDDFPLDSYNEHVRQTMIEWTTKSVPVKAGAHDLLSELKRRKVPTAVATSTASPTAPDRLRRGGLLDFFDTVVTRSDVINGKPHPEPFQTAARRLNVAPSHCLALEDSHNGIRSAHAAGMQAVMVPDLLDATAEVIALCRDVLPNLAAVRARFFS